MTPETRTPTAVTYLRVSTAQQAEKDGDPDGYSIPAQRDANLRKAETLGAKVIEVFVDRGESARSADRPELQRMLKFVKENQVDYCIVHKVDRLARSRVDDVEINLALEAAGVRLVSATENIDETPSGMLLHGVMSSIAEFYSRNLANEVMKGMLQKAKTGGTPGRAPLGYRNQGVLNGDGREVRSVAPDEDRAPLIRHAFVAYATGEWSLQGLAEELALRGLASRPTPKVASRPLTSTQLQKMLTNPYYKGVVTFQGVLYPGRHEAIVDSVTWQRVQDALGTHLLGEKERSYPHYLKGSVVCAECGSRLIIQHSKNRHGVTYEYFVCSGRHEKRNACTQSAIPVSVVEERVLDLYQSMSLAPELRDGIEAALLTELASSTGEAIKMQRDLNLEKARLQARERKLLDGHLDGAIPADLYKAEQQAITSMLAGIQGRLQNAHTQLEELEGNLKTALDLVENCYDAYLRAPNRVRRAFNQAFFERIKVGWDEDTSGDLAEPFQIIAERAARHQPPEVKSTEGENQVTLRPMDWAQGSREQLLVPLEGLEPPTLSLGRNCSSIELQRLTGRFY